MITLNPGNIPVLSLRMVTPQRGVWLADCQLDPAVVSLAPSSGRVTIVIAGPTGPLATLTATVDPRGSGAFSSLYALRVLGGGGGWDKPVAKQFFASDGGVFSPTVYSPTAALVGEVASVLVPRLIGAKSYTRFAGAASQILDREPSWWVDPTAGTTFVGPRPPAVPDPSLTLLFWDAATEVAHLTCDTLVLPGTPILDPRIGASPVTVCDVEQVFDERGSTVTAWCTSATPATQLASDLRAMVQQFSGVKFARGYLYRITSQAPDGRLALQAVDKAQGLPDMIPIAPWAGMAGLSAKFTPGAMVRVSFPSGDPGQAIADLYEPGVLPSEVTLDALAFVHVGGPTPLVLAPPYAALLAALTTFSGALAALTSAPLTPVGAAGTALQTALAALPPPATVKTTGS